jgi:Protein of unknown function (DUF2877)
VRDRVAAGCRGVVLDVQRRACHIAADGGPLLILSRPGVPLAPNAFTVDLEPNVALEERGFRPGQGVSFGGDAPSGHHADWVVELEGAAIWEPHPRVRPVDSRDLVDRVRTTRATVVAEGAGESLLPLLWMLESDAHGLGPGIVPVACPAARLLCNAAIRGDTIAIARAASGLAGLGPGLTPSGDDLLAGFVAAWTLVGEAVGRDRPAREHVTATIATGAVRGASPLGHAWLEHACQGELLEPMTRFVETFLASHPVDLGVLARDALGVGASSGTDWMVGFLLAAETMLDAPSSRLQW